MGRALGWKVDVGQDGSGSGFVHTYDSSKQLFPDRAAALQHIPTDLVVIEGGLNDEPGGATKFFDAVVRTVHELQRASGNAPVVLLGPASPSGTPSEGLRGIDQEEEAVAAALHIPYISPVQEHWVNPANVSWIIDPKTGHPSTDGHLYFGARVAQALEAVVRTG